MRSFRFITKIFLASALLSLSGAGYSFAANEIDGTAASSQSYQGVPSQNVQRQNSFGVFAPKPQTLNTRFDYSVWDAALEDSVVQFGPSLRRPARRPRARLGSRIIKRTDRSPYRLEGSRVTFHSFSDRYESALNLYKEDLVRLANVHDIQAFNRNEQLAFWINLHNVVLIDAISQKHPTSYPSKQVFGLQDELLHDAKLITIKNIPLSLRDIREKIVYQNWKDPNVIYGFFRGDIGGPGIMHFAVTRENVKEVLFRNGLEYATSLRGFQTSNGARNVSIIYHEARPYFFPNWSQDLETHLATFAKGQDRLLSQVQQNKPFGLIKYETLIADLWGGNRRVGSSTVTDLRGNIDPPPVLIERFEKLQELSVKGLLNRRHRVRIIDEAVGDNPIVE